MREGGGEEIEREGDTVREGGGRDRERERHSEGRGRREQETGWARPVRSTACANIQHQPCEHLNKLCLLDKSSLP